MHRWIDVRGRPDLLPEESEDPNKRVTIVGCFNCDFIDPDYDVNCHSAIFEYEKKLGNGLTHYFELKKPRIIECLNEL